MWLCRHCFRPVGLAATRCPRCGRRWPAVTAAVLRHAAVAVLFALLLVGAVRLARWAALGV